MKFLHLLTLVNLVPATAFAPGVLLNNHGVSQVVQKPLSSFGGLNAEAEDGASEAVFVADVAVDEDATFDKVEKLGKGAAKVKRGKRKGGAEKPSAASKVAASLTPEEVFYEGPPAITETIVPTISILTVVGIIPAAAAWARQAWVRYKITSRRIRVTSGVNGNEMAEIVYPDIVEMRTVKRLFGDGDMVAFLRDGAKFEMRNIPDFENTMEFILKQVDEKVAAEYKQKGDVTNP
mmetsp:Transcript_17632/g.24872  ORF Transcript_17632/g.24872 Transcript_17632/m.24872 type:complete len:235 (-) Transcript_17632:414-1118(-)|eukprot:CAMPEP_0184857188 /NCGR_PEP_ID=MMETSP0580-20130426/2351_1 /TAXON_ID=1118495 /ORGANISM="Dactyliosolen fragilissimus" /LENGTH=234 /DNA_ID=CAMNT_0027352643 /DNA_START=22 /DNA_END=726 /DNA_ORIENTATION=-